MFFFAEDIEPEGDEEEDEKQPEVPSVRQSKYSMCIRMYSRLHSKLNIYLLIDQVLVHF